MRHTIITGALLALLLSGAIYSHHLTTQIDDAGALAPCSASAVFDCSKNLHSAYGRILGVPVSSFATAFFIFLFVYCAMSAALNRANRKAVFALPLLLGYAAGLVVGYYLLISVFVLHSLCLYCAGLYVIVALTVAVSWIGLREPLVRQPAFFLKTLGGGKLATAALVTALCGLVLFQKAPLKEEAALKLAASAPIAITEYIDFECPACKAAGLELERLKDDNRGKLTVEFVNYPLCSECNPNVPIRLHANACTAAKIGIAMKSRGKFDAYCRKVFAETKALDEQLLYKIVSELRENEADIRRLAGDSQTSQALNADIESGRHAGVLATPTLAIGGKIVDGSDAFARLRTSLATESQFASVVLPAGVADRAQSQRLLSDYNLAANLAKSQPAAARSVSAATGRTFYMDFAGGNDSNLGNSKAAPWKHAPGMHGCSGLCAAAAPQPGDNFIFKGGVTWDHTCFEMDLNWSGEAGNPIYYGADVTWFAGGSFTKPVFSGDHTQVASGGSYDSIIGANTKSYITLDNIEIKGHRSYQNFGAGSISIYCMTYFVMSNLYVHDWQLDTSITTDDAHGGIIGNNSRCYPTGTIVTNSVISNTEGRISGRQQGLAIRSVDVAYSKIFDVSSATIFALVHDTEIYNVGYPADNQTFDPVYHTNVTYAQLWDGTWDDDLHYVRPGLYYNNIFHDTATGANGFYLNACPNVGFYVFNNLNYHVNAPDGYSVIVDQYPYTSGSCGQYYIWNNTFEQTTAGMANMRQIGRGPSMAVLQTINNHYIQDGNSPFDIESGVTSWTDTNNVTQTHAAASAQGYTAGNFFAPTSGSGATVGAGTNLASNCGGLSPALCSDTTLANSRTSNARPSSGAWDAGAYQFAGSGAQPSITSSNSSGGTVGAAFSYQIVATNSPGSFTATGLPPGLAINTVTGLISGTPMSAGTSTVALSATNSFGTGTLTLRITIVSQPQDNQTLLTTQQPVADYSDGPGVNYELGMRFQSDSTGQITAVRFWKSVSESGAHTGNIWSASGALLTSVTFSNESASGWQEQALPTPLQISANAEYLVSVNTGNSYYVADSSGFASQIVNLHLSSIVGSNGRYGPMGQYPTLNFSNTNYFRDVRFVAGSTPPPNHPPAISSPESATPNPALAGQSVSFIVSATDLDGDPLTYAWSFGDGLSAAGNPISHTYAAAGAYTATVTVSDGHGGNTSSSVTVTVTVPNANIALSGVAYRWFGMTSATVNTNRVPAPGLNDNDLTTNIDLSGAGTDSSKAYEAGGVIWASAQTFAKVTFINGSYTSSQDGVFDSGFALQVSANGTAWTNVTGWTLTPAYSYNSPAAGAIAYTFTGPALTGRGVRCVGRVHTSSTGMNSWYNNATEVQVFTTQAAAVAPAAQTIKQQPVVDLGSYSLNQPLKIVLASSKSSKNKIVPTAVLSAASLPTGVSLKRNMLSGRPKSSGTFNFAIHMTPVGEVTMYRLTVLP